MALSGWAFSPHGEHARGHHVSSPLARSLAAASPVVARRKVLDEEEKTPPPSSRPPESSQQRGAGGRRRDARGAGGARKQAQPPRAQAGCRDAPGRAGGLEVVVGRVAGSSSRRHGSEEGVVPGEAPGARGQGEAGKAHRPLPRQVYISSTLPLPPCICVPLLFFSRGFVCY